MPLRHTAVRAAWNAAFLAAVGQSATAAARRRVARHLTCRGLGTLVAACHHEAAATGDAAAHGEAIGGILGGNYALLASPEAWAIASPSHAMALLRILAAHAIAVDAAVAACVGAYFERTVGLLTSREVAEMLVLSHRLYVQLPPAVIASAAALLAQPSAQASWVGEAADIGAEDVERAVKVAHVLLAHVAVGVDASCAVVADAQRVALSATALVTESGAATMSLHTALLVLELCTRRFERAADAAARQRRDGGLRIPSVDTTYTAQEGSAAAVRRAVTILNTSGTHVPVALLLDAFNCVPWVADGGDRRALFTALTRRLRNVELTGAQVALRMLSAVEAAAAACRRVAGATPSATPLFAGNGPDRVVQAHRAAVRALLDEKLRHVDSDASLVASPACDAAGASVARSTATVGAVLAAAKRLPPASAVELSAMLLHYAARGATEASDAQTLHLLHLAAHVVPPPLDGGATASPERAQWLTRHRELVDAALAAAYVAGSTYSARDCCLAVRFVAMIATRDATPNAWSVLGIVMRRLDAAVAAVPGDDSECAAMAGTLPRRVLLSHLFGTYRLLAAAAAREERPKPTARVLGGGRGVRVWASQPSSPDAPGTSATSAVAAAAVVAAVLESNGFAVGRGGRGVAA